MALIYQVQAVINASSNLPEDASTNTWFFTNVGGTEANVIANITNRLFLFYNDIQPLFSSLTTETGHLFKVYDALAPAPREPLAEQAWVFTQEPIADPLPTEVALCMSYSGPVAPGGGETLRTNRGRLYIGPLNSGMVLGDGRVEPSFRTILADACVDMATDPGNDVDWGVWSVFSRKLQSAIPIDKGYVDNEFDTQRRRGRDTTARTSWSI